MGGIFINYRSTAPRDVVDGMYRQLAGYFGEEQVFRDRDSIRLGHTYWEVIEKRVIHSEVLLTVIHKGWARELDERKTERDWVRDEIELALKHEKKIIPVLIDDAARLTDADLPKSIRDLRGKQGPHVRTEFLEADVAHLIGELKRDVSPTWTPSNLGTEPPRRPGRWLAYLTGLLALVLLAGPAILVRNDPPAGDDGPPLLPIALLSLCTMLAVPIIFGVVLLGFGRVIGSWEREAHRAPVHRYNRMMLLVALVFIFVIGYLAIRTGDSEVGRLFVFGCLFIAAMRSGVIALRGERVDRDLDREWPHEFGNLPRPPALRRAVVRFEERLAEWRRPLSREQEDKATFMLTRLTEATGKLAEATTRRHWLLTDHRWGVSNYILWVSATVGLVVASAVPEVRTAPDSLGAWIRVISIFALSCGSIAALSMEVGYRHHRRWRRTMVAEVGDGVQRLEARLKVLMEPPPWERPGR